MQFLVLFRRKWPLTLLYRPPFILKLETPTFFGHHFFISFFLFHFPVHFIVFIVYSILPFSFLLFSHTKKDQVHKREKKKKKKKRVPWGVATGVNHPNKKDYKRQNKSNKKGTSYCKKKAPSRPFLPSRTSWAPILEIQQNHTDWTVYIHPCLSRVNVHPSFIPNCHRAKYSCMPRFARQTTIHNRATC